MWKVAVSPLAIALDCVAATDYSPQSIPSSFTLKYHKNLCRGIRNFTKHQEFVLVKKLTAGIILFCMFVLGVQNYVHEYK